MFLQGKENDSKAADRKEKKALPAASSPQNVFLTIGRAFFLSPLKAGLTVEAACVLPLFLWAVLGALYLIEVSVVQTRLVGGIHEAGRKMALLSYGVYGGISEEEKGTGVGEIVGGALTAVYAKNLILKKAGLEETFLKEQVKISLAASDFSEKNIIDLKVMSRISLPVPGYRLRRLKFLERGRVRAWTGRSPSEEMAEGEETEGETVYVALNGSVYHRDPDDKICFRGRDGEKKKFRWLKVLSLQLLWGSPVADGLLYPLWKPLSWFAGLQCFEENGTKGSVILSQRVESLLKMWITFRKMREDGGK